GGARGGRGGAETAGRRWRAGRPPGDGGSPGGGGGGARARRRVALDLVLDAGAVPAVASPRRTGGPLPRPPTHRGAPARLPRSLGRAARTRRDPRPPARPARASRPSASRPGPAGIWPDTGGALR